MKATFELEMPQSCAECKLRIHGYCIGLMKEIEVLSYFETRHPDCPLKTVKEGDK